MDHSYDDEPYDEERELRAMVAALTREYQALTAPLVARLAELDASRPHVAAANYLHMMDSLPDDVRQRLKAHFDALS